MRKLKKICLSTLLIVLLVSTMAITIYAGDAFYEVYGDFYYEFQTDNTILIMGLTNTNTVSIEIPSTINGNVVTSIGEYAFLDCTRLTTVTIANSVTTIGDAAFSNCHNLTAITIPNSVTSIGNGAFTNCSSLTTVNFPHDITSIGEYAFLYCTSLTTVTIPYSITSIDHGAFRHCDVLTDIYYSASETMWNQINIGSSNEYLTSATIHYNYGVETLDNAIQYVPYTAQVSAGDSIVAGRLPKGLGLFSDGTIAGMATETGTFYITLSNDDVYAITVESGTETTVESINDYTIIDAVPTISSNEIDQVYHISGPYDEFLDFYIDGVKMIQNVEYIVEGETTKITILGQTFAQQSSGTHTITATFTPATTTTTTTTPVTQVSQVVEKTVEADTSLMPYSDVATSAWYYDYVYLMYRRGIIAGTSSTTYSPESNLTRAMMVDALYQLAGAPEATASSFSDVDYTLWYAEAVNWASETGITNGTGDNQFSPDKSITREEMATMLQRYCDTFSVTLPLQTSAQPTDLTTISDWATTSATAMYQRGVLTGDTAGNFNPSGTATRAEAASMFSNFLSILDRI